MLTYILPERSSIPDRHPIMKRSRVKVTFDSQKEPIERQIIATDNAIFYASHGSESFLGCHGPFLDKN